MSRKAVLIDKDDAVQAAWEKLQITSKVYYAEQHEENKELVRKARKDRIAHWEKAFPSEQFNAWLVKLMEERDHVVVGIGQKTGAVPLVSLESTSVIQQNLGINWYGWEIEDARKKHTTHWFPYSCLDVNFDCRVKIVVTKPKSLRISHCNIL